MLKTGARFVFVVTGLAALAIGTGCGGSREENEKLTRLIPEMTLTLQRLDDSCGKDEICHAGVRAGQTVAFNSLPSALETRSEGKIRVTTLKLKSLPNYDFRGPCGYEIHGALEFEQRACIAKAKAFLSTVASAACAHGGQEINLERIPDGETVTCVIDRTEIAATEDSEESYKPTLHCANEDGIHCVKY